MTQKQALGRGLSALLPGRDDVPRETGAREVEIGRLVPNRYQPRRDFSEAGCLISYGPSYFEAGRRAASYVHKILRGAHPFDLPVEQPTTLDLVVNRKAASALGLAVPQSIVVRARIVD